MDGNKLVSDSSSKFANAVDHFLDDLKGLRTGRASASMLDGVMVESYGTLMPIIQVATVAAVESQLIQITPFDPSNLENISAAIRNNPALGLNPSDDGRVVRIPIPPLTEERRREIAKQINEKVEDCMVRMRGVRHESLNAINQLKKDKDIGEDEAKRLEKQVDEAMNKQKQAMEEAARNKEKEILTL